MLVLILRSLNKGDFDMSFAKHIRVLPVMTLGLILIPTTAFACSKHTAKTSVTATPVSQSEAYVKGKTHYTPYAKPGASVTVSHNYSGQSKLGGVDNIRVSFKERDTDGVMTVKILPSAGLNIASAGDVQTFQMSGTDTHEMDISVTAQTDGQYFVNLLITADRGVGSVSTQSYGIPIYAGSAVPSKQGSGMKNTSEIKKVSGGLIVMEAQETIIQ